MILPIRLFRSEDVAAIAAHEELVLKVSLEVAREVLAMFGETRRMTDAAIFERAALGYARPLALVMKHIDFGWKKGRAERIKGTLLEGAADLATKGSAFLPPALELACASSYCIAYPGGVDLYEILPDIYVRPSLRGDAAGFARTVDNMDMYWNDACEGIRRVNLIGQLQNEKERRDPHDVVLPRLLAEEKDPLCSHYHRRARRLNIEWRRKEGDPSPSWVRLARYWAYCRAAVQIPEIKS